MNWKFNPQTQSTDDGQGIVPRVRIEEAAEALYSAGIRNERLITDVLKALSGLSGAEVMFNVELALSDRGECFEIISKPTGDDQASFSVFEKEHRTDENHNQRKNTIYRGT